MRRTSHTARLGALFAAVILAGLSFGPAAAGERSWSADMAAQFKAAGLAPAMGKSYLQPLKLQQQTVSLQRSSATLSDGAVLALGQDLVLDGSARQPARIAAPLFFLGSREPGPAMLHELRGKVVVMMARDAAALDPAARAAIARGGVAGFLTIGAPAAAQPVATAADAPTLFTATAPASAAARLFSRSGRDYAELSAQVAAGRSLPSFPLDLDLNAQLAIRTRTVAAANVVGVVRGSDPLLAREYVVVSAEAASAEAVLGAARRVRAGAQPKRSVLFAVIAPQQRDAFAARPPVSRDVIVASLNAANAPSAEAFVAIAGAGETSLGLAAHALAATTHLAIAAPSASGASGSGALGFLQTGVPALGLVFGGAEARSAAAYLTALTLQVADNDAHPAWMRGSRFAPRAPQAQQLVVAPVEMPLGRRPQRNLGDYARLDALRLR